MKFSNQWKTSVEALPDYLQSYVLVYKKWKKMSKFITNNEELLNRLTLEANDVDNILKHYINKIYKKQLLACVSSKPLDINDIYNFAVLNKITLYKICKRLDKRHNCRIFREWLNNNYNKYIFNTGLYMTKLYLDNPKINHDDVECPICYDSIKTDKPFIILECGHVLCLDCVLNMFNKNNHKALLFIIFHLDEYTNKTKCPVCSKEKPLHDFCKNNVYPAKYQKIANKVF